MNNYIKSVNEMKRESVNYSKKIAEGLDKPTTKFVMDMIYGITKSKNVLTSEIARALDEEVKLEYTIERICDNLQNLTEKESEIINTNYLNKIKSLFPKEPVVLLDDTDIAKEYGKKFEDLCLVRDASSIKEKLVNGYHVCEAVALSEKEKQPVSLYSKIYSTESDDFRSMNNYTLESIKAAQNIFKRTCTFVGDRAFGTNLLFNYLIDNNEHFVIRLKDDRKLLFKGKSRNVSKLASERKGKVKMSLKFEEEEKEVYLSHIKVQLPTRKEADLYLVIVYGLSEENPMLILTNKEIKTKKDCIKIVRTYMYRWRIEVYFEAKKQEYHFENIRVRSLKSMNNLNLLLSVVIGQIGILAENINSKLLTIKIIYASNSLREKVCVWYQQIARGIAKILSYARTGIKEFQRIEKRKTENQLSLF